MTLRLFLLVIVLFSGCIAGPAAVPGTDDAGSSPAYESFVFDYGGDRPAIEGGLRSNQDPTRARYYVTTVTSESEAVAFDRSVLDATARLFVSNTSYDQSFLVVFQVSPASSMPDHRVEAVRREDGTLRVSVNDSSSRGTNDVTVETVLLRVRGPPPERVTVLTEEGHTVAASAGVVTVTPDPTPTPEPSVELPYASADASENVVEPRDLRLTNEGTDTHGYRVEITATTEANQTVTLVEARGKLRPGATRMFRDVVARRGTYDITIAADLPTGDGGRQTVTETFSWRVDDDHGNVTVSVTDEQIRFSQT